MDDLMELPQVKIKGASVCWYEMASGSKLLFQRCLKEVPHLFLEATKKKWREAFKRRNQQN